MVGDLLNISNGNTDSPTRPINSGALRCILGSSAEWSDPHRGTWSAEEATHHINYLELLAAFLAINRTPQSYCVWTILQQ